MDKLLSLRAYVNRIILWLEEEVEKTPQVAPVIYTLTDAIVAIGDIQEAIARTIKRGKDDIEHSVIIKTMLSESKEKTVKGRLNQYAYYLSLLQTSFRPVVQELEEKVATGLPQIILNKLEESEIELKRI